MSSSSLAALSASQAALAAAAAQRAEEAECRATISEFKSTNAAIEDMREYSRCVEILYPDAATFSLEEIILLKILTVGSFVVAGAFMSQAIRNGYGSWWEIPILGLFGLIITPVIVGILLVLFMLLAWVFGA